MRIEKILNNNAAVVIDAQHKEMVVMGRGLAFQHKVGDEINPDIVEKQFIRQEK